MTRASMLIQDNNATTNVTYDGVINSDLTGSAGVVSPLLVIRNNITTEKTRLTLPLEIHMRDHSCRQTYYRTTLVKVLSFKQIPAPTLPAT